MNRGQEKLQKRRNKMNRNQMESILNATIIEHAVNREEKFWTDALHFAISKIKNNIKSFSNSYPAPASKNNVYASIENVEWTSSFWTGMLYLAWEATGDNLFKTVADGQISDYRHRLDARIETNTHDLGFLYTLSCIVAWRLDGNISARATALKAADLLLQRYNEKAGIIQAWGDLNDPSQRGRIIIDCDMNLPLLFWASEETRNPYYREAATSHIYKANEHLIRSDWSTFHTFYFDTVTGNPLKGDTHQGYSNKSCWARGQTWGIYGNALSYRYLKDPLLLSEAKGLAHYFLNRLPEDMVPYWDLIFVDGPEERDSSAAVIGTAGLLELAGHLPHLDPDRRLFENAALKILESLILHYTSRSEPHSNGILLHGVYGKPQRNGIDECTIWGDFFFMESLMRVLHGSRSYW